MNLTTEPVLFRKSQSRIIMTPSASENSINRVVNLKTGLFSKHILKSKESELLKKAKEEAKKYT